MTEYEQLSAAIESRIAFDPHLRALRKKIAQGTATLSESAKYSRLCAQIMGQKLSEEVLGLSDREGVCTQLLLDRYSDVNQVCEQVMRSIDEIAGIAMNPRHAAFPAERVQQLAHSLVDLNSDDEIIQRRASSSAANVANSFHDDFVEENAAFRSDAGYECYITRVVGSASCPWCSGMAGRYKYEEIPEDMFKRHDNCTCTVTFEQGSFRQDVWSKRSWEAPETGAGAPPPKVFSQEEADRLEQEHLAQIRGLRFNSSSIDNSGESGIIEDKEKQFIPAKTIAEAEQYGRQFADTVNYSGLSLDNVNIINETLTELNRLYPTNKLEIITSNSKLKNSSARSSCASLSINPLIGTLGKPSDEFRKETISSLKKWKAARTKAPASLQKKYDNTIKQLEESLKYDRWSVSNGIDTKKTITHEYGHIIADQYFGQINNKLANPNCYSEEGIKLRRLVNEAYQKAKSTGDIYKISKYASSDEQEFFAETFAMYHLGEELPEYINDMVKGVLEHGAV